MIDSIRGRLSAKLLGSRSHRKVSNTSLVAATSVSLVIALLAGFFAIFQWRAAENLVRLQNVKSGEISRRVEMVSGMATCQANAHRATLGALLARDLQELNDADALRQSNLQEYRDLTQSMGSAPNLRDEADKLLALTAQYGELSGSTVDLLRQGRKDEALDLRSQHVRGLFDRWQRAHLAFSESVTNVAEQQSLDYKRASAMAEKWLKLFVLAPLALIILGMVAIMVILGMERFGRRTKDTWLR